MLLAAQAAHAQSQPPTMQCPYTYLCADTTYGSPTFGSLTFGGTVGPSSGYNTVLGFGAFGGGGGQTVVGSTAYMDATSHGFTGGEDARMTNVNQGVLIGDLASMKDVNGVTIGVQAAAGPTQSPLAYRRYMDDSNVAVGNYTLTAGLRNTTVGEEAQSGWQATDTDNTTIGARSYTEGDHNSTLGAGAQVVPLPFASSPQNSVAIGAGTVVNESWVVGFGGRRLIQLLDGTGLQDAVTIHQLIQPIGALGGGASLVNGVFQAPTYSLASGTYHDVGSALSGLQTQITNIDTSGGTVTPPPAWLASDDPNTAASANGWGATAVGANAKTGIAGGSFGQNTAIGTDASAGTVADANGTSGQATAVGADAAADAPGSTALGQGASTTVDARGSVALGQFTTTDRARTVAVGNRTLSQLANGTDLQDGATINQMNQAMAGFGGGASFLGGVYTAPQFILTAPGAAGTYTDTNSALLALDNGLNAVNQRVDNLPTGGTGGTGPQGPQGATGPQGPKGDPGQDGKDATGGNSTDALAVHYDDASQSQVTLAGADGTTISNVKAGVAETDAANVGQVQQAINTANSYTDNQVNIAKDWAKTYTDAQAAHTLHDANAYTDMRFGQIGDRISRIAALSSASSNLASNYRNTPNSIAAGLGWSGGHNALSVGFRHVSHDGRMSWSVSGGVSGSERTVGMGIGYGW